MIRSSISLPLPPGKRAKKRNSAARRWFGFAVALFFGGGACWAIDRGQIKLEDYLYAQISAPIREITVLSPLSRPTMELEAKAALCFRGAAAGKEKVIFEKNADEILPIASLTKLMTARVVLENPEIYDPSRIVFVSAVAAGQPDAPVSGNLFFGEVRTVKELLDLMLFYSSNDAAYALAELMGESEFVSKMNRVAAEIGLSDTEFFNSTGLDLDDGRANYSTARDLLALSKNILEFYPEIFTITKTPEFYRTQNGIFDFALWEGQTLAGGKTGYTERAGGCMIAVLDDADGWRYIGVLLGAANAESRVAEMQKIVNFSNNY